jgi:small subunit ribosomal protein S1
MNDESLAEEKQEIKNGEEEPVVYDWPDDRFRELVPGQIIEAKVILVRDDLAFVDIGGKSDLVIPVEELTTETGVSAKSLVKAGDILTVLVTRSNDDDKILLSKRLVDQEKIWIDLADAFAKNTPVTGVITEAIKGGLQVNVGGIRAFMPASQSSLSYVENLSSLTGETCPVKIIELNRATKRVVVSRRVLLEEARKIAEQEFFASINEGERKQGKVTRIADFGAFVDLGSGIEGLIHVSEVSWNRVKTPREVLKEGDQIEFLIIKLDQATKKISLSLKQLQKHPWDEAAVTFQEGGIYPGTVVRMESFGAFIRLAPGVDGMAHVSQIADRRISKPDEVLKIGQEVQAKVLKIDTASRKISLSLIEVGQDQDKKEMDQFMDAQAEAAISQNLGDLIKQ